MGLWNFISKMAQGKPVFEDTPQAKESEQAGWVEESSQSATTSSPFVDERGRKIIPEITIAHCKSHLNGAHMEVTAWLTNESEFEVELSKMTILDVRTVIGRRLHAHEGHEVTLYRGVEPSSDHAHKAQLYYKIVENGDNFCADYMVEYNRESNGMFTIEELHADHIVHDV